jgi:hypothetical protein
MGEGRVRHFTKVTRCSSGEAGPEFWQPGFGLVVPGELPRTLVASVDATFWGSD